MEEIRTKDFFDMILPGSVKFLSDHYVVGDSYRSVWVIREYPPSTEEQAILSQLADRSGVTLRIYHRLVESMEQRKIIQNATRRNKLKSGGNDVNDTIEAEGNLQDVIELLANLRKNKEPLLHCSVFIELKARSMDVLKELQSDIAMELTRSKISVDRLTLRQKEGFLSVIPTGYNQFGAQYERVLPASSVANLYPFNFSGKTDPHGLYIGRDKYGTNILVDFDRRAEDKTTSNVLILGNSGQGKSYLLKLILTNIRESGKAIICLDPESEYEELCNALGGCYIDFMSGEYTINPLEPKAWTDGIEDIDAATPEAFKKVTRLICDVTQEVMHENYIGKERSQDRISLIRSRMMHYFKNTSTLDSILKCEGGAFVLYRVKCMEGLLTPEQCKRIAETLDLPKGVMWSKLKRHYAQSFMLWPSAEEHEFKGFQLFTFIRVNRIKSFWDLLMEYIMSFPVWEDADKAHVIEHFSSPMVMICSI